MSPGMTKHWTAVDMWTGFLWEASYHNVQQSSKRFLFYLLISTRGAVNSYCWLCDEPRSNYAYVLN
jgi:hypothetical protein